MPQVIIASKNPVKIKATKDAFVKMFPDESFTFVGVSVESDVPDQPTSSRETLLGAKGRVKNARKKYPEADYWVGIEGGVEKISDSEMQSFGWAYVESPDKNGKAQSAVYMLPLEIVRLIDEGRELGEADDVVFERNGSKQDNGSVGILTGDVIVRSSYYTEMVILALIPFKNSSLY